MNDVIIDLIHTHMNESLVGEINAVIQHILKRKEFSKQGISKATQA